MKTKANIGISLVICFIVVLTLGIILHLKSHGILIEPRKVIKTLHWIFGFAMAALLFVHWSQFGKVLKALKKKYWWFYTDTLLLIVFFLATLCTGLVKLFSPVKIPHLGLWHYWCGILMSITVIIHLVRALPIWMKMNKAMK